MKFFYLNLFLLIVATNLSAQQDLRKMSYQELDSLIAIFVNNGDYSSLLEASSQAVNKAAVEGGKKDSVDAHYLRLAGTTYMDMGRYPLADSCLKEVLEIRKKVFGVQHFLYIESLNDLALLYEKIYKLEEAEPIYLQIIKARKQLLGENDSEYALTMNDLGMLYQKMGRYDEAETSLVQAKNILKTTIGEEHPDYAMVINNLALLYWRTGKNELAEPLYLQTLLIIKTALGEQHPYYISTIENLAVLYRNMQKFEEAEKLYLQAKDAKKAILGASHPHYGLSLSNLANFYIDNAKYKEAQVLLDEALRIHQSVFGEQSVEYIGTLSSLAQLFAHTQAYELAEKTYCKALKTAETVLGKSHPNYINIMLNVSSLYSRKNNFDKAFDVLLWSLKLNSSNFDELFPNAQIETIPTNSKECILVPNFRALKTNEISKFVDLKSYSLLETNAAFKYLLQLTKVHFDVLKETDSITANQKLWEHYEFAKVIMQRNEKLRNEFAGKSSKLRILKENSLVVKDGIDAAFQLGQNTQYEEAFGFAELNKSVLLLDALKGERARALGDLPIDLINKEIELEQQSEQLKKKQAELPLKIKKDPASASQIKEQLIVEENTLNTQIDSFLKSLKDKYPKYHALKYQNIIANVKDVQALLDEKSLFLEYFVANLATYLFVIQKDKIETFKISIAKDSLDLQIKNLRKSLSDYEFILYQKGEAHAKFIATSYWFYEKLLAAALKNKKQTNLIIVTDDKLGHLPFEVFLTEPTLQDEKDYSKMKYLLNDFTISYNYSATLWKENLANTNSNDNGLMLACAAEYNGTESKDLDFRTAYTTELRKTLNPLPATKIEVEYLEADFAGNFLQNEKTNEADFKQYAQDYSIIHFAMHGILNPQSPMLSSLAFTENGDSIEDNFLQAFEIAQMKFNANLVVLSACETGYGKFEQGEGVLSLARSFMYAGVPSLVVSLWQVNDASTAWIMKNFYQNLAKGMDKATALQQAKLSYLRQSTDILAHPAFWSAFIQLGDSKPIHLKRKSNWLLGLLVGGVFAVGLWGMARKWSEE